MTAESVEKEKTSTSKKRSAEIICVDLDGTLLRSDLLHETFCALIKQKPLKALLLPLWLLKGRAFLKRKLAEETEINPALLPYHEEVLAWVQQRRGEGATLVLATASDERAAKTIADHLGIFDQVVGSDGSRNLKGRHKAKLLSERFADKGFCYVGNSNADRVVWRSATRQVAANCSSPLQKKVRAECNDVEVIAPKRSQLTTWLRAVRVHQWVKNLLVFVPLIMAHKVFSHTPAGLPMLLATVLAFISFSFCASSVYLINDLLDLESDRQHHSKRNRPFAHGDISLVSGMILVPILWALSIMAASFLAPRFLGVLLLYFALTTCYSFYLKQVALLDVIVLASLYTIRIFAGGVGSSVKVSQWMLAFSMFFFFSLACVKRFSELHALRRRNAKSSHGRGYEAGDLEQIAGFGTSSAHISILVLALYVSSTEVTELYAKPQALWLICPLLLYWVSRVWLLAQRGVLHEDPIVFAIHDKVSYLVGLLAVLVVLIAI